METTKKILVADDEPGMRHALREVLQRAGWEVLTASSGEEAADLLRGDGEFALLITDYRMGGMTGVELVREARRMREALPIVMMTAYGTVEDAVEAMRAGAADYLLKPFSMETVLEVVNRATKAAEIAAANNGVREPDGDNAPGGRGSANNGKRARGENARDGATGFAGVIAEGPQLRGVLEVARSVADADATVLLSGESGTGKEVVARFLHTHSGRTGPFVALNCAALPEGLLESELFGHEKGAFTGAIVSRKGRFEQAAGGTLLLDEISEMPLALQVKLLRVIQEKEIVPVGGSDTVRLDVRIVATTNRDLERDVAEGRFREDLFYRLNVIALTIPPLREREGDVLPLARHFLKKYQRPTRPAQRLGHEVEQYLRNHRWPGNVRELENMMERATLLTRGEEIQLGDLHLKHSPGAKAAAGGVGSSCGQGGEVKVDATFDFASPMTLEEMERRLILKTLSNSGGNRTRTADLLGVSVRTIRNKLNHYGLSHLAGA